jgi:perosamine synthetase
VAERGPASGAGADSSQWLRNGTTALHVALKAVGCKGKLVAVQPNVCPNVIAAIFSSGNRPLFVDIERARLGMDPERLRDVLGSVGAVLAVHSFGIPCLIDRISSVARRARVPLIEDCAQAEGASYAGQEVGSYGDAAVFSYGAGKIVDAGGGGRIMTSEPALTERVVAEIGGLPESHDPGAAEELSISFKRLYNEHYPNGLEDHRGAFTDQLRSFATRLLGRAGVDTAARCKRALTGLSANVESRRSKARLYARLFKGVLAIRPLPFPDDAVPWRYNIWMDPARRNAAFKKLLRAGIPASTWYPSIDRFITASSYESAVTPNASWLDEGILNLWLDDATDQRGVENSVLSVANALE